jgi:hypothetical protein
MLEQIVNIHNTLCEIKTCGEDTIKMAQCLVQLRQLATQLQSENKEVKEDADDNS